MFFKRIKMKNITKKYLFKKFFFFLINQGVFSRIYFNILIKGKTQTIFLRKKNIRLTWIRSLLMPLTLYRTPERMKMNKSLRLNLITRSSFNLNSFNLSLFNLNPFNSSPFNPSPFDPENVNAVYTRTTNIFNQKSASKKIQWSVIYV
jgi:hypothetical protein